MSFLELAAVRVLKPSILGNFGRKEAVTLQTVIISLSLKAQQAC